MLLDPIGFRPHDAGVHVPWVIQCRSSDAAVARSWDWHMTGHDEVVWCDHESSGAHAAEYSTNSFRSFRDPLEALAYVAARAKEENDPSVRWVGFLSYDLGRLFESLPVQSEDDLGLPLFIFVRTTGMPELPRMALSSSVPAAPATHTSTFSRAAYERVVGRAIEYIQAGDIFQVNLSQRLTVATNQTPEQVFGRLEDRGGATYAALLRFEDFAIVSNSPELFLLVTPNPDGTRTVTTRPIKGTRPRLAGMDVELRDSIKDQAELNMIVDLERNDLGRVCEIGSVRVSEPRVIEDHPTVYHGVATIEGVLREDVEFVDLLRATFPGGSVTGAPKIRAMEIIEELEPNRRGPYCGAIGHLSAGGAMAFNIAIRTITMRDGLAHVPVGGGIVADSIPSAEYEETIVKARAALDALGIKV